MNKQAKGSGRVGTMNRAMISWGGVQSQDSQETRAQKGSILRCSGPLHAMDRAEGSVAEAGSL